MDLIDRAKEAMGPLERVFAGLPGIKGYKEKELRRESDKRVRDQLAGQLMDQKRRLDSMQEEVLSSGYLGLMDDMERAGKKLLLLADRVRTASYGYAPAFDLVRIKEAQLDALVAFDQSLFAGVERVRTVIDGMSTLGGRPENEWKDSIGALSTVVDNLNSDFGHREEVILNASGASDAAPADAQSVEPQTTDQPAESEDDGGLLDRLFDRK